MAKPVSLLLAAILAATGIGIGNDARGVGSNAIPSRIVDRTFGCTPVALSGRLRAVDVNAVPTGAIERSNPAQNSSPGFIGVASGGWEVGAELVSIRARGWQRFAGVYSAEGVYASIKRCAASRAVVPLSPAGLPSPPVRWLEQTTCVGRGRVLIRVRTLMQSSGSWRRLGTSYEGVRRKVVEGVIAVRSEQTGKPIAYMELERGGTTRLWYSPGCEG